jgi:hypothetical protein
MREPAPSATPTLAGSSGRSESPLSAAFLECWLLQRSCSCPSQPPGVLLRGFPISVGQIGVFGFSSTLSVFSLVSLDWLIVSYRIKRCWPRGRARVTSISIATLDDDGTWYEPKVRCALLSDPLGKEQALIVICIPNGAPRMKHGHSLPSVSRMENVTLPSSPRRRLGLCASVGDTARVLRSYGSSAVRAHANTPRSFRGSDRQPPRAARARSSPRRVPAERRVKDSSGRFVT